MKRVLVLLCALFLCSSATAHATPPPIEQEVFSSVLGKYTDMTYPELLKHLEMPAEAPSDAPISFDVRKARFYDLVTSALELSPSALKQLRRDGLVIVDSNRRYSMAAAYYDIYTSDLPVLITTDSILDAMHRSFDDILAELEVAVFMPALKETFETVGERLFAPWGTEAPSDKRHAQALADLDIYLTTARNLLERNFETASSDGLLAAPFFGGDEPIKTLLKRVESLRLEPFPGETDLYGSVRPVDWSQFKPRGHYTKSPALKRYFRAMMWLGRVDLGFDLGSDRQLRAAALLALALSKSGAGDKLESLRETVGFMVGAADNLTPAQLVALMAGEGITDEAHIFDDKKLKKLRDAIVTSGAGQQRIRSQVVLSMPNDTVKTLPPPTFQLFGQRFVIDSFALAKVVFDDIIFKGEKQRRLMPSGLDVMAALGNNTAVRLLAGELGRFNYSANLAAVREVIGTYTDATWRASLYTIWLDALRSLNTAPSGEHVPELVQRDTFQKKMLNTQLASWAQLRHDTILYAKQSYTATVGCEYPAGYVEPYPAFYAGVGYFAAEAARRFKGLTKKLGNNAGLAKRYTDFFENFAGVMGKLETMARKQLAAEPFDKKEVRFIETLIDRKAGTSGYMAVPVWSGWYMSLLYGPDQQKWKPTIADVHTDTNSGLVLEVGTGDVNVMAAAIDNDGDRALYAGPVMSYYEFTHPASDRLTDQQWAQKIWSANIPDRPSWLAPFVVKTTPKPAR